MSKVVFSLLASLFIAAPVAAIENGDTVYVDYDLQGGVNNPDNIAFSIYTMHPTGNNIPFCRLPRKVPNFWAGTRRTRLPLLAITSVIPSIHTKTQTLETS